MEISNAYEVLSDDSKRREYDQQLRYGGEASINRRRHHSHAPSDFNSPFDDIFNVCCLFIHYMLTLILTRLCNV